MHRHRKGGDGDAGDRLEVFERVELRPVLEQRLGDMRRRAAKQQRVAVGPRARGLRRAEGAATPPDILDHQRAEPSFHLLRPRAADRVVCSARRKRDHEPYRSRRIVLRAGGRGEGRQSGNARDQMQKTAAWKFHRAPLRSCGAPHPNPLPAMARP